MSPEFIKKLLRAQPFAPFRLHLIDGSTYDVRHPDMVLVGYQSITIGVPRKSNAQIYQTVMHVSLVNLGPIEILEQEELSPPSSN